MTSARERLVATAQRLFARQGYSATGLAQIIELSAASRGSFYHYFPGGKVELGMEVVGRRSDVVLATIDAAFAGAECFEAGARRLARHMARSFEVQGDAGACPIASILLSAGCDETELLNACRLAFLRQRQKLCAIARRFRQCDDGPHPVDCAQLLMIFLSGAWIVARAEASAEAFAAVANVAFVEEV